jgi:2-phosphosulfolactate phosphatase
MSLSSSYRCQLDWGRDGTRRAVERGDVLVIVDVLSFSTAVATAVHNGGIIYPCSQNEDASAIAQHIGGEVAVHRRNVPQKGRFSLSPVTYRNIEPGTKVVLASPNGATCSRYASQVPYLFVGALVNAQAVALAVSQVLEKEALNVTMIACGERWETPSEDGELRFAIEDYLGAGAILSYLQQEKSPEAHICEGAFLHVQNKLAQVLWECESGRELCERGFDEDVQHAAQLNVYALVPVMHKDYLTAFGHTI